MTEGSFPKVSGDTWHASEANNALGIISTLAGENITTGNVVYVHITDGKAYISDTGTANDIRASGIALTTVSTGNTVQIQTTGIFNTSSLTAQQIYYLGASGALSTTVSGVRIGTAVSTTQLNIQIIQDDRDMIGTIKPYNKTLTATKITYNITAFWKECDGSTLSDTESPLHNTVLPLLNGTSDSTSRFLQGATTSGTFGGAASYTHGHGVTTQEGADPGAVSVTSVLAATVSVIPPYYQVVFLIKVK